MKKKPPRQMKILNNGINKAGGRCSFCATFEVLESKLAGTHEEALSDVVALRDFHYSGGKMAHTMARN